MIKFIDIDESVPYKKFLTFYDKALKKNQKAIEAICISSFNTDSGEVDSRYVNLKYILNSQWIFFTNYNSPKSIAFETHNKVSVVIYWERINLQIRIKANIVKSDSGFSDKHFNRRSREKNSIAISSNQSNPIQNFDEVLKNYSNIFESNENLYRPESWGGYSFTPYYIEFWKGHSSRLNKRDVYEKNNDNWNHFLIQP